LLDLNISKIAFSLLTAQALEQSWASCKGVTKLTRTIITSNVLVFQLTLAYRTILMSCAKSYDLLSLSPNAAASLRLHIAIAFSPYLAAPHLAFFPASEASILVVYPVAIKKLSASHCPTSPHPTLPIFMA
jgi:hypothetical protein